MLAATLITDPGVVRLRDGRRLSFQAVGSPDGFPVIFMHGALGSPRWRTPELDAVVASLGIHCLVVDRPGFARSDPCPDRTVADYGADVEDLADALGLPRFSVIGVSAGAPFALACGWALPDRVIAVAAASPLAPSHSLRYRVPATSFRVPVAGPLAFEAGIRLLGARAVTGARNVIEDVEVCRRPWGFAPGDVQVPVVLWHGRRDRLVPVAHALRLAEALPACAVHLESRAGHFFFGRRVAEIIGSLLRAG